MKAVEVVIVSPALQDANNGNWQTARRWQRMLAPEFSARILRDWRATGQEGNAKVMLALHARRSAASIAAWAHAKAVDADAPGLAVVLTGTDLYRDIQTDAAAIASLRHARVLVTLQERGPDALAPGLRAKARVIFQSTSIRRQVHKTQRHLRVVMVGHLRDEKAPQTLFEAARILRAYADTHIDHVGAALDPALGAQARATARQCAAYHWHGALPHEATRRLIQRAHLLVHCSRMEGGAHVVMEAVCCGTPVLASRIPGNMGMLGNDYAGYFATGDARALAELLLRCRADQGETGTPVMQRLMDQCARRAPLFAQANERACLHQLVSELHAGC